MKVRMIMLSIAVGLIFTSCSVFQKTNRKGDGSISVSETPMVNNDTIKKNARDSTRMPVLKPYKDLITSNVLTRHGLFSVHKIGERYFFEIPNRILEKDILVVSRIAQAPGPGLGKSEYAGDQIGECQIEFSRGPGNKLFIRLLFYNARSADSSENGMYRTVNASNLQPIQAAFDIKAFRPDSSAAVIDVTDFLNSDNPLLYFDADIKSSRGLGGYQKDKSYITDIKAFPLNVEIHSFNTYLKRDLPISYALNVSFLLLPEQPMQPRFFDKRVGYFFRPYLDFDGLKGVERRDMITRWRLEPKEEDQERYLRGELVEPKKPIVYYIDPATPKKWVSSLIKGVNDWQKAFEKAGFKNAIYALEAPTHDSSFSLFDARHSAIIYKASPIPNASGPHIHDPRTGEILETHINWYHNVQSLLHDWYMVQAGPNDPGAQKMLFDDTLMGQLIRFVCSHEVGHTLGLRHNMGASSTVPTDSLRSKTYLEKNGFCSSIMDYARFNYVAQPEDGLSREQLMPRIGVYDEWTIEWGYRWLPQLKTRREEEAYMNQWVISSLSKDKRLWWGEAEAGIMGPWSETVDPRSQLEDLGDNNMKANFYGILNLKRVMSQLTAWTLEPNQEYDGLARMYGQVIRQYTVYMMHVANNIGNKYVTQKKAGQQGPLLKFIPKVIQKQAMQFLAKQLFDTPDWLYNKDIFGLVGGAGAYSPLVPQKFVIDWLVTYANYVTMSFAQMQQPKDAYTFDEFLTDIEEEIWKELRAVKSISFARRNLQKIYLERLLNRFLPSDLGQGGYEDDFYPLLQKHLQKILQKINQVLPSYKDETSRWHLLEAKKRIQQGLHFSRYTQGKFSTITATPPANAFGDFQNEKSDGFYQHRNSLKCKVAPLKGRLYSSCWYPFISDLSNQK